MLVMQSCRHHETARLRMGTSAGFIDEGASVNLLGKQVGAVTDRGLEKDGTGALSIRFAYGIAFKKPIGYQVIEIPGMPGNGFVDLIPVRKDTGVQFFEFARPGFIGLRYSREGVHLRKIDSATLELGVMRKRTDFYLLETEIAGDSALLRFSTDAGIVR